MAKAQAREHGETKVLGPGEDTPSALATGVVKAFFTAEEASIETEAGESLVARQAASCLLAPAIGDRVLVFPGRDCGYILAVLERSPERVAELAVPGAGRTLLRSGDSLEVAAPKMTLTARRLSFLATTIAQAGTALTSNFKRVLETVVDKTVGARTITTRAETRTADVREVETLKAGMLVQTIDTVTTQNSEIALVTAKRDVRLDATRVTVG